MLDEEANHVGFRVFASGLLTSNIAAALTQYYASLNRGVHGPEATHKRPLWVISGHLTGQRCPLYPQKRTLGGTSKSAFGCMEAFARSITETPSNRAGEEQSGVKRS